MCINEAFFENWITPASMDVRAESLTAGPIRVELYIVIIIECSRTFA